MAVLFLLRDIRSSVVIPEIVLVVNDKNGVKVTRLPFLQRTSTRIRSKQISRLCPHPFTVRSN